MKIKKSKRKDKEKSIVKNIFQNLILYAQNCMGYGYVWGTYRGVTLSSTFLRLNK